MKIALLSDIHANAAALDACLAHASAQGAVQLAFLGDLVGYGPQPREVLDRVMALATQGAWALMGNHDERLLLLTDPSSGASKSQPHEEDISAWTLRQIGPAQLTFLAGLPLTLRKGPLLMVHASTDQPEAWRYMDDAGAAGRGLQAALAVDEGIRYLMAGHVHHQRLFYRGAGRTPMLFEPTPGVAVPVPAYRHWVATVGSVGQPRDGRTEAAYATLDLARHRLCFHRVAYDHMGTAQAIRQAGLPDVLARRILEGR